MHTCKHVCMYIRVCMRRCMCLCMYVCTHACMHVCMYVFMYVFVYILMYPPTPFGVERVRTATITNNQPPSPISKQGSTHRLVQSPDTETSLPGQPTSQPAELPMTNHCHQPAQPQATSQPSPCPRASSHQFPVSSHQSSVTSLQPIYNYPSPITPL